MPRDKEPYWKPEDKDPHSHLKKDYNIVDATTGLDQDGRNLYDSFRKAAVLGKEGVICVGICPTETGRKGMKGDPMVRLNGYGIFIPDAKLGETCNVMIKKRISGGAYYVAETVDISQIGK